MHTESMRVAFVVGLRQGIKQNFQQSLLSTRFVRARFVRHNFQNLALKARRRPAELSSKGANLWHAHTAELTLDDRHKLRSLRA